MAALCEVVADDPYKVLFLAGWFKEESNGTRAYDVFYASTGIVSSADGDGGNRESVPFLEYVDGRRYVRNYTVDSRLDV